MFSSTLLIFTRIDISQVVVDPTGGYLVCTYLNKSLRIYDFVTGEAVAQAMGHAEVITGSIFLPGCKHMISVSSSLLIISYLNVKCCSHFHIQVVG